MLLKDLKEIIQEADEPAEGPADGETPVENETQPKRAKRDIQAVKDSSDGVGKEAYKISTKLETKLQSSITNTFNVSDVKTSNNVVYIYFKGSDIKMKHNGMTVSGDVAVDNIQSIIMAILGADGNNFNLTSKMLPGLLTITIVSNIEKDNNGKTIEG